MPRRGLVEAHYKKHYKKLCSIVSKRLGNDMNIAEEAVQEAYTRALNFLHCCDFEDDGFDKWFSTILNNSTRDAAKDERNRGISIDDVPDIIESVEPWSIHKCVINAEVQSITRKRHKEILHLHFNRGLSSGDISKIVDVPSIGMVEKVLYRFKKSLLLKYR